MNGQLHLRDIHAAADPSWWPPAPGWWLLAALLLAGLAVLARLAWRRYRAWRRQRRILGELDRARADFQRHGDPVRLAAELSVLLRRAALAGWPRERVAGVHGRPWLEFLDRTGGGGKFRDGPGRVLASAPYAPRAEIQAEELCALVADWLKRNSAVPDSAGAPSRLRFGLNRNGNP